ncbi:MAG TPA: SMP-30/gluconolactonase/LRE family protein [Myxococcota bacterium]|nr:SMP-30/gluconolactonase/LRE family protein [Myxococcota bacterium]
MDLRTREGVGLVGGQWQYQDVAIDAVAHREPGPDRKASGAENRTHDVVPNAGSLDAAAAGWRPIAPESLEDRRGHGRLSFAWYRIALAIPPRVGGFDPTGATAVFEITVDDYAEVWVDGRLPQVIGQVGGALAAGWNAPNRVVLTRDARPGQRFDVAVFAANAPLSAPPVNFVWVRSATLDLWAPGRFRPGQRVPVEVERRDPRLDALVPRDAVLERVAGGFEFVEGPVWSPPGFLLFSDPNRNVIYRWDPDAGTSIYRTKSGYSGLDVGRYGQPGSNGLAFDPEGRLTIAEHGNRRVTRLEPNGTLTVLADRLEDRRLNSPNDLVHRSDGTLWISDPPFGLPGFHDDPAKELPDAPVLCRDAEGALHAVARDLRGPNGLAFSPDERFLYVTNWDPARRVVMRYPTGPGCTLGAGAVFFDMEDAPEPEALDGIEADELGNLYVSGPGGTWVLSPEGVHLGTIRGPELAANYAWGDADGRTLYIAARTSLYRMRMAVGGRRP